MFILLMYCYGRYQVVILLLKMKKNDINLILGISQDRREMIVPDTPDHYAKLYIGKYLLNFN